MRQPLIIVLASAVAVAAAVGLHWWAPRQAEAAQDAQRRALQLEQTLQAQPAAQPSRTPQTDFTASLPVQAPTEQAMRHLLRASAHHQVTVTSVSVASTAATAQSLGKADMSIALTGPYPQVKAVVGDLVATVPGLVVQRLVMRRPSVAGDIEAQVELSLLTRPAAPTQK